MYRDDMASLGHAAQVDLAFLHVEKTACFLILMKDKTAFVVLRVAERLWFEGVKGSDQHTIEIITKIGWLR